MIQVQEGVKRVWEGLGLWSGNPGPGKRFLPHPPCSLLPFTSILASWLPALGEGCWRLSSEPEEQHRSLLYPAVRWGSPWEWLTLRLWRGAN